LLVSTDTKSGKIINIEGDSDSPINEGSLCAKGAFEPQKMAKEVNGYFLADVTLKDPTGKDVQFKKGDLVPSFAYLQADGSTSSGIWLYTGSYTNAGNMMTRRGKEEPTGLGLFPNWAWCWPANRRVLYNRASCDLNGQPWNPKRALLKWEGGKWVGDVPDGAWPPMSDKEKGKLPFIMKPDGHASLFGPGMVDGPLPEHYEPVEGPLPKALMSGQMNNPAKKKSSRAIWTKSHPATPNSPLFAARTP
jgi:formate dehydrogenase major subunit